jgi:hypothetical protein
LPAVQKRHGRKQFAPRSGLRKDTGRSS